VVSEQIERHELKKRMLKIIKKALVNDEYLRALRSPPFIFTGLMA